MEQREMYAEVNALMGALAKAFDIAAEQVARAVEAGEIALAMQTDDRGAHFVAATYGDRQVRLYQGAIRHAPEAAGG